MIVYTIGHSNIQASALIALLKKYEVNVVLDVRSSPYSQYSPQFDRKNIEASLKEAEIEYRFAGEYLGGRPKDPTCYKNQQVPDGKADYLHLVDYPAVMTKDFFQEGIQQLLEIAKNNRTAIMCSEGDPAKCHRHHLIGRYLTKQGVTVLHIRNDGLNVKDQQLPNLQEEPPATQLKLF